MDWPGSLLSGHNVSHGQLRCHHGNLNIEGTPPSAMFLPRKRQPFLENYEAHPQIRPAIKLVIVDLEGSMGFGFLRGLLVSVPRGHPLNHLVL